MKLFAWILFIGLCINAGAIIFSYIMSFFLDATKGKNYLGELDLSALKLYSNVHHAVVLLLLIIVAVLKVYIVYYVLQIFRKLKLDNPFNKTIASYISGISLTAFYIAASMILLKIYAHWLTQNGLTMTTLEEFTGSTREYIFFGAIIYTISLVFKRGIEMQTESELTI